MESPLLSNKETLFIDKGRKTKNYINFNTNSKEKRHIRNSYVLEHRNEDHKANQKYKEEKSWNKNNIFISQNSLQLNRFRPSAISLEKNNKEISFSMEKFNGKSFPSNFKRNPKISSKFENESKQSKNSLDNFTPFNFQFSSISQNESLKLKKRIYNFLNTSLESHN